VFRAEFGDGSMGVFVSNLIAAPEPAGGVSFVAAATAVVAGGRRGRRHGAGDLRLSLPANS
jgi:hypothetical protein